MTIVGFVDAKEKRARCVCDQCGREVIKYVSQLTNAKYQFCDIKCSTKAKGKTGALYSEVEATSRLLYGVDHYLMANSVKQKRFDTNIDRYGVSNQFERPEIIERNVQIAKTRTEDEWRPIREKRKLTCLERYGVEFSAQSPIVHDRQRSRYKGYIRGEISTLSGTFWYRSSWELLFLEWCVARNVKIEANVFIPYDFDSRKHVYFADFLIDVCGSRYLCEIKPDALAMTAIVKAKFDAAYSWCDLNEVTFVHVNKHILENLDVHLF